MKAKKTVGCLMGVLVLACATGSFAQTWTGGGADNNWTTDANWGGTAPVPGTTTTLTFDGTVRLNSTNDFAEGVQFFAIKTGATAGDFTLNGAQIQLGNGGGGSIVLDTRTSANNKTLVINNDLDIKEGIGKFIGDATDTITLNGVISNPGSYVESQVFSIQNATLNLTNPNNSFNRGIGMINATLTTDDLKDSFLNSKIGAGSLIKLGNAGSSGHFVYNGAATTTDRQIQVGGGTGNVGYTGNGTLKNDGSGAITFSNTNFNRTEDNTLAVRTLTLGGAYDGASGANVISGVIADNDTAAGGILHIVVEGSDWQFEGTNTYTGDTTVDTSLTLTDDAQLTFVIGSNGVNNAVGGTGSVVLDGDFVFDLTSAGTNENDTWTIVDAASLTETFGATFTVAGFTNAGDGLWKKDSYQFDESTGMLSIPVPGTMIYQDDFSGAAGPSTGSTPEISPVGFVQKAFLTGLDGSGRLESTNSANTGAGYRVKLGTEPLTDDASIEAIRLTVDMRTPTNDWVMIGFQEQDANGLLVAARNAGPMLQFNPASVALRGGTWGGGNVSPSFSVYSAGDEITAVMTYHVVDQTMDLSINGLVVTNGFALEHEFPVGTNSDPVVYWLNSQLRRQPTAADGGAYIDSWQVEILPEVADSGYAGWAAGWGTDIGAETNDYDGDGLLNVYEYGLGGDPTNALDQGTSPESAIVNDGGTNWFGYVHPQLAADQNSGLSYYLELNTNLVSGIWTNAGYFVLGTNVTGGELDFVTNVTDTVDSQKFIRLIIE